MRRILSEFASEPIYNMKAVEQQTGISAPTLRAWERRYHLIAPQRTESGYRLYSDQDVALLRWVRHRIDEGLTVGRVSAILTSWRDAGEPIVISDLDDDSPLTPVSRNPVSPVSLIAPLYEALIALDESRADQIMAQAFALYKMPTVYVEIVAPVLVEIGEAWHQGELLISTEHFAITYFRGRLFTLLQAYPNHEESPSILVACAPHETHEIGALILAVMLRQEGFNVLYLGQNMPLDDLILTVKEDRLDMICLSAASPETARPLADFQDRLNRELPTPVPIFIYGGRAFDQFPDLRQTIPGHYLNADPRHSLTIIRDLLRSQRA